jgi:hypothetical protein
MATRVVRCLTLHTSTFCPPPSAHTTSLSQPQLNEPSAIMELKVDKAGGAGMDVVRFEMSAAQVAELVAEVDAVDAQIKKLTA